VCKGRWSLRDSYVCAVSGDAPRQSRAAKTAISYTPLRSSCHRNIIQPCSLIGREDVASFVARVGTTLETYLRLDYLNDYSAS
jgi:hypothetical protein